MGGTDFDDTLLLPLTMSFLPLPSHQTASFVFRLEYIVFSVIVLRWYNKNCLIAVVIIAFSVNK